MIAIVTGGRTYDGKGLRKRLDELEAESPGFLLYVGDASGADAIARAWGHERSLRTGCAKPRVFEAYWKLRGPKAGPERNRRMIDSALATAALEGRPLRVIATPGGRGTADCVRQAKSVGLNPEILAD
jgi:hypothetical protein